LGEKGSVPIEVVSMVKEDVATKIHRAFSSQGLVTLELKDSKLTQLPSQLGVSEIVRIKSLVLSGNELKSLSDETVGSLSACETLELSGNALEALPIPIPSLVTLVVKNNVLKGTPDLFGHYVDNTMSAFCNAWLCHRLFPAVQPCDLEAFRL
jgi:hypothetical protein